MPRLETPPRARILAAAHAEFAASGLSGARIDAIAREAHASKERLYAHFATKRSLFDATLAESVERWSTAIPFDAQDLPGWAARLYDHLARHPDDGRLLLWAQIEGAAAPSPGVADLEQLEARRRSLQEAQAAGHIGRDWSPDELTTLVLGVVLAWFVTPSYSNLHQGPHERRTEIVRQAVARLVA